MAYRWLTGRKQLMLQPWLLILCALAYIGALFGIAYYSDFRVKTGRPLPHRALIFSLSLAVYCTSWTYYGAVGKASSDGWSYLSIYIGPIITFVFGYPFLRRVTTICKEHNITTIADFISSRYGKSQLLAVLVALIAIMGTLPYIALQLKAVALSYQVVTSEIASQRQIVPAFFWGENGLDTGLVVALLMAVFSILFGTRYVNASEHHEGIIVAIAFESIVKLLALIAVALFAVYSIHGDWGAFIQSANQSPELINLWRNPSLSDHLFNAGFITPTILAMMAIFLLPRQFHVTFVESTDREHLKTARWLFPLYLLITCLVIIPITITGSMLFQGLPINPDMFVLTLPMSEGSNLLTLAAFIGGFSAATSMVIIAVITLSTMVCNDIVMPWLFKINKLNLKEKSDLTGLLLGIRRCAILAILLLGYAYYRYISEIATLASIGLVSFVAAAQFAPAVIGGVYWKQGHRKGATYGLIAGFSIWFYTLLLPTLVDTGWLSEVFVEQGLWGISWLRPYALFGLEGYDPITHSLIWSMVINTWFYIYFSLGSTARLTDRIQAAHFTQTFLAQQPKPRIPWWSTSEVGELRLLAERYIGKASTQKAFAEYAREKETDLSPSEQADSELVRFTEHLLAGAIGASSARLVITSMLRKKKDVPIEDIVNIVDEASQAIQFNQDLLHTTIEHIDQGISVVDKNLQIVAWNNRYIELFDYPSGLIQVGRPIAEVIRYNAENGECGPGDIDDHVNKRLQFLAAGTPHSFQRFRDNGTVLEMHGNPMPGGGFVTSFSDITEHKKIQQELVEINENLEQRVQDRTQELSVLNQELRAANSSKTHFIAAVNHDLMQPLNAARLFTSSLMQKTDCEEQLVKRIAKSLQSAEEILNTLVDISKLDSGSLKVNIKSFPVADILKTLSDEFSVVAEQRNIQFDTLPCSLFIQSDSHLLRRILQNFLSNALRYTREGRVLIGCRRRRSLSNEPKLLIQVWDTGVGIAETDISRMFKEFERLDNQRSNHDKGVGLGLAIAKRISQILEHPISVQSQLGRGTVFSLEVPVSTKSHIPATADRHSVPEKALEDRLPGSSDLSNLRILCIDNDPDVLDAMQALLLGWSCQVVAALSETEALKILREGSLNIDIMLVDYHLDKGQTGIEAMKAIKEYLGKLIPGILITADFSEEVKEQAIDEGYRYLRKPVNPGALRSLISKISRHLLNTRV